MIIDCIGCLHGHYPNLEGGDLLIVTGDLTAKDTQDQHMQFLSWIALQDYNKKIWIAGNHDGYLEKTKFIPIKDLGMEYLCDSGTEFEGFKIWGSPWTLSYPYMNPRCKAFTCKTEDELAEKWDLIPIDIDILITHGPPRGMLDLTIRDKRVGSKYLNNKVNELLELKLHAFSHIHESYGQSHMGYIGEPEDENPIPIGHILVNCSHVDVHYRPVNEVVRIVL